MYYPYFRGKMNELKALQELLLAGLLSESIIPIIEPVSVNTTQLIKTIELFVSKQRKICIVQNPYNGDLHDLIDTFDTNEKIGFYQKIFFSPFVIPVNIIEPDSPSQINDLLTIGYKLSDIIALMNDRLALPIYQGVFTSIGPKITIVQDNLHINHKLFQPLVIITDSFTKQLRNVDYYGITEEYFSDFHLEYQNLGYVGYSDYSIIGRDFFEPDFARAFAVVIHLVVLDNYRVLKIRHYVSDTNYDASDVNGKIKEAFVKIKNDLTNLPSPVTLGMNLILQLLANGQSTNLGGLKKFSIMHHLELIGRII